MKLDIRDDKGQTIIHCKVVAILTDDDKLIALAGHISDEVAIVTTAGDKDFETCAKILNYEVAEIVEVEEDQN